MKIFILYFSGSGNTQLVAHHLFNRLREMGHDVKIRFARKGISLKDMEDSDGIAVGSPVYAYSPSKTLMEVIQGSIPEGKGKPAFIFLTYGGLVGNAHLKLATVLEQKRYRIVGYEKFLMADSLFIGLLFGRTSISKWLAELPNHMLPKKLEKFPQKVVESLEKGEKIELRGCGFRFLTDFIAKKFNSYKPKLSSRFYADSRCDLCGVCVSVCPRQNIRIENGKVLWGEDCELCFRCYTHCPLDAIQLGKLTRNVIKYKPHIP